MVFSALVYDHWIPAESYDAAPGQVLIVVDGTLAEHRPVSLLRTEAGPVVLTISPDRARELSLAHAGCISDEVLADRLASANVIMNDPDYLFYLPLGAQKVLRELSLDMATRQLTESDEVAFAEMAITAPPDDWAEAYVDLDHWLVFGTFVGDRLVSAASMYPWHASPFADIGVITLPAFRRQGLASQTLSAISCAAMARGYEPQYRCQLDNTASAELARSVGFAPFGKWEIVVSDNRSSTSGASVKPQ